MNVFNIILLLTATVLYSIAAYTDIRTRKVSNKIILVLMLIGCIYSYLNNFLLEASFGFIVMNAMGLLFLYLNTVSPGDSKLFSTFAFFFNLLDTKTMITVLIVFTVIGLGYGMLYPIFKYKNIADIKNHYKQEYTNLFLFVAQRKPMMKVEYQTDEEMKSKTHPFAVQILIVFVVANIVINTACI